MLNGVKKTPEKQMKISHTTTSSLFRLTASFFLGLTVTACNSLPNLKNADERWLYIMYVRHSSKDIAISCSNAFDNRISSVPMKRQYLHPEFKNFQAFGCVGEIHTETSFIPQETDKLNIVVNDVELREGESIQDFNGFTISAEVDSLVISSGKHQLKLSENHDWSKITEMGSFDYVGARQGRKYRYQKWCLSPLSPFSDDFEVYSVYIPNDDIAWFKRKIWYTSSSKSPRSNGKCILGANPNGKGE